MKGRTVLSSIGLIALAGWALLIFSGCSRAHSNTTQSNSGESASGDSGNQLDVGCMMDRVDKPTEPFHFSYKYADASSWVDEEADITPQAMEITIKGPSGSHNYRGVRSDETSWGSAVLTLSNLAFTALTGQIVGFDGTSAVVRQGAESVNGYNATKFAVDTTAGSSSDRKQWAELFGAGSFNKGTIWMGPDACAVKVVLDEGVSIDGKIQKRHYEISRALKQ